MSSTDTQFTNVQPIEKKSHAGWYIAGAIVVAVIGILVFSYVATRPPKTYPTAWECIPGVNVPLKRVLNLGNDIACLSEDGRNCIWTGNCEENLAKYKTQPYMAMVNPLVCQPHEYSDPNHWCYKGNKAITKF